MATSEGPIRLPPPSSTPVRFEVRGLRARPLSDLYHYLMRAGWWRVTFAFVVMYCSINAVFAGMYWLGGPGTIANARPGSFADAYWFSVQTFATIGYGGLTPASIYANVLVTLESFSGLLCSAFATGILFAKFSRPAPRIAFSRHLLVSHRNGQPYLVWRVANQRATGVLDATVKAHVLMDEISAEGARMRRAHPLTLDRHEMPVFNLAWTLMHRLDEQSPLFGLTPETLRQRVISFIVSFSGVDSTTVQSVHARQTYLPDAVQFGYRFADMIDPTTPGLLVVDHAELDSVLEESNPSH